MDKIFMDQADSNFISVGRGTIQGLSLKSHNLDKGLLVIVLVQYTAYW